MRVNKLNIFIAGSKVLDKERSLFKIEAQDLQVEYAKHKNVNIQISVCTFESFGSVCDSKETLQERYNNYIVNESDVVFFIFDGDIGGITLQEYEVAEQSYKTSNKPKLCVFTKVNAQSNENIEELKSRISNIGQYWIDYTSEEDLRFKINKELSREIDDYIRRQKRVWRRFSIIAMALLLVLITIIAINIPRPTPTPVMPDITNKYNIDIRDELDTKGRLIVKSNDKDEVKYYISNTYSQVDWNNVDSYLEPYDTLYPKNNCVIQIYGYSVDNIELHCEKTYTFNFCNFVETAIRTKNVHILEKLFDNTPLTINLPGGYNEYLRTNPIQDLYTWLEKYDYHITSVSPCDSGNVLEEEYNYIKTITLEK